MAVKLVIPHGGVEGTRFGGSSAHVAVPEEYNDYVTTSWTRSAERPPPEPVPADEVAHTIRTAVDDETERLRYLVGNDARGIIAAWSEPYPEREERLREALE